MGKKTLRKELGKIASVMMKKKEVGIVRVLERKRSYSL